MENTESTFTSVPVIDFKDFLDGSNEDRQRIAADVRYACRHVGFFYLLNHGISQELIDRVFAQSERFFNRPVEDKMRVYVNKQRRGYTPVGEEKISARGDLKELFDMMLDVPADDNYKSDRSALCYGPNMWPTNVPGFRECIYDEYFTAMLKLSGTVLQSFALALGKPIDWFKPMITKPLCQLRLIHYLKPPPTLDPDQMSCGEHTDHISFTLLAQQPNILGLQVKNNNGDWINAPPIPGTLVVNIGELMERWSNCNFKATEHRVVLAPGVERYSVAFFFSADYTAKIECCVDNETPKFAPITCGQYFEERESSYELNTS